MRGLVSRIHVFFAAIQNVDGRDKPGHDETGRQTGEGLGPRALLLLAAEAAEALVEAGELAAGVEQLLLAAGPGRVRLTVDLEAQRVAGLPIGGPGLVAGAVRHLHGDLVVVGMDAFLHEPGPSRKERLYIEARPPVQLRRRAAYRSVSLNSIRRFLR